ncbi:MAG: phosphate ABC transporter permease PstA [Pirellulales bacterium]|nr:phosphate ABC transporter permease PstA [Pirellulales bacterium]
MISQREAHSPPVVCYLLPKGHGNRGQYAADDELSFEEVLQDLEQQCRQHAANYGFDAQPWHAQILCANPGDKPRAGKPHYRFYVDAKSGGAGGDGSETTPWRGIDAAIDGLNNLRQGGQLPLEPGRHIHISHRETFSATPLEKRRLRRERIAKSLFAVVTALLVIPVIVIIGYLIFRAWPVLSPSFILDNPTNRMTAGGIWAPLVGTVFLAIISLLIDAPIGILAAIYLNEYASDNWFTRLINLAVVNLAGVPSIVHGLFGVGAFVLFAGMGKSVLAASCTLAVMSLPVIITATREALAAVPMSFREACWNMGATRWQTIRTIVLPNSISGILTGVVFEIARTAGETAPILFTGVVFYCAVPEHGLEHFIPYGLNDSCMALSYHLFALATQVRGVAEEVQYGTAVVLIGFVLTVNSISIVLRARLRSRKKW